MKLSNIDSKIDTSIWAEIKIYINLNFHTNQSHYQTNAKSFPELLISEPVIHVSYYSLLVVMVVDWILIACF